MGKFYRSYRSSLASQLTAWYGISAFVLVLGTTYFLYWSTARTLQTEWSTLLMEKMQTVRLILNEDDAKYTKFRERVEKEWPLKKVEKIYVRVTDSLGKVVAVTPNAEARVAELMNSFQDTPLNPGNVIDRIDHGQGRVYRALLASVAVHKSDLRVSLVLDCTDQYLLLKAYRERLYFVLFVSLFLSLLVGWRIAIRGLKPVRRIAEQAGRIRSSNLHERIDTTSLPIELSQLAGTFNGMLNRLEESFGRLSRFSADLAHELRTPVNNMSGEIEVALGRSRSLDYYQDTLGSCLEECERISKIIDSLLFLARCENPKSSLVTEKINLKLELQAVLEFYEVSAVEAGIATHLEVAPEIELHVERTLFQRAVGNLLSNAIKQTPAQGKINVIVTGTKGEIAIKIEDSGNGISSEHLPHVFERFYRVDASRSKASGGAGLGLAIVKSIAILHGGKVEMESALGKGTKVSLYFPKTQRLNPAISFS